MFIHLTKIKNPHRCVKTAHMNTMFIVCLLAIMPGVSACRSRPAALEASTRQIGEQTLNVCEGDPSVTAGQILDGLEAQIREHDDIGAEIEGRSENSLDVILDLRSAVAEMRRESGQAEPRVALPFRLRYELTPLDGGGFAATGRTHYIGTAPLEKYPEATMFGSMLPLMLLWEAAGK